MNHDFSGPVAYMDDTAMNPISIGLDDGYAFTKVALPDGRLIARFRRARVSGAPTSRG